MIEGLKPYPEYKDSELRWLGKIPKHWKVRRLRASITDCVNGIWGSDPNGRDDLFCVRVADFDRVNLRVSLRKKTLRAIPLRARSRRLLRKGDLLLEKSGGGDLQPVGAVVLYDHDDAAVCSNFVARMPTADGYSSHFLNYLHFTLYAHRVNLYSIKQTTGIQNLDGKSYLSELVGFPPPGEQDAIVRFIDHASGRLERMVREKRKLIALLREQKQAIIHRAVTRGFDPSVPLKPSGVPWLGDIPKHWELWRISRFARVGNGSTPSRARPAYWNGGTYPWLNSSQVNRGFIDSADQFVTPLALRECHLPRVPAGSVLVAITGQGKTRGMSAVLGMEATINQHIAFITPRVPVASPEFIHLAASAAYLQLRASSEDSGSTKGAITCEELKRFKIAIPPAPEQEALLSHVRTETRTLNAATDRLEREIELLREYRTSLVADVVTGNLDVREAASHLSKATHQPELPIEDTNFANEEGKLEFETSGSIL